MRNSTVAVVCLAIAGLSSSCLKTRAELKGDSDEPTAQATPADVEPVNPGGYALDEVKSTITQMEGRLEDVEHAQASAKNGGVKPADLQKLDDRVTALEQAQESLIEQLKKLQETTVAVDPSQFLTKGKAAYKAGKYDQAVQALSTYLKSSKAKKTEEATFLRGDSYYKLKEYKKAIVDFSKFPEKFTKSQKMPQALYKIGLAFDKLGMHDDARGFYQELVDKFPKSPEGKKAKKKVR